MPTYRLRVALCCSAMVLFTTGCAELGKCTLICDQPTSQGIVTSETVYHDETEGTCEDERDQLQDQLESFDTVCRAVFEPY